MDPRVEELLAEFIMRRDAGEALEASEFVAQHAAPDGALAAAIDDFLRAEARFAARSDRPRRLGDWIVGDEIGRGGSGRVFLAEGPGGVKAAVKLLSVGAAADARAVARMEREGALLLRVRHPSVVRVHSVGAGEEGPWIAMEHIAGRSLAALLADARARGAAAPLELEQGGAVDPAARWRRIATFGAQIARAIESAHDEGLLHRDVKPSNVMLREDGTPVLIDFGLAALDGSTTLTRTGDLVGTPQYMAPEQARGERAGPRTDVYGIGATLHEVCTLEPPAVEGGLPLAMLEHLRRNRPRRLEHTPGVPPALARVIDRALAFKPSRRTESACALAEDLERFARGEATSARRAGMVERVEDRLRARPRAALALGVLACLALGLVVAATWPSPPSSPIATEPSPSASALDAATRAFLARDDAALVEAAERVAALDMPGHAALLRGLASAGPLPIEDADPMIRRLALGEAARREKRFADALPPLLECAVDVGDWALPLVLLGGAARDAGELEIAEREWTAASRLVTDSPDLFRRLGKVRAQRGDGAGAVRAYRRAYELAPGDWTNAGELARELAKQKDPASRDEALRCIDEAIRLAPDPPAILWNVKAALLDGCGRRAEAREIYRRMVERSPAHVGSWFNLGYSYDLDCELFEARQAYEEVTRIDPRAVNAHFALAKIANGSERDTCERCAAEIAKHPELVDAGEVARRLESALRSDECRSEWLPAAAAALATKAGRGAELAEVLRELVDARESVDAGTVRLERALRDLRRDSD